MEQESSSTRHQPSQEAHLAGTSFMVSKLFLDFGVEELLVNQA